MTVVPGARAAMTAWTTPANSSSVPKSERKKTVRGGSLVIAGRSALQVARSFGGGRDRLHEGRAHGAGLQRADARRRGPRRRGDHGAQRLGVAARLLQEGG